ncbi:MAG: Uma2 family endonuclease [Acidobacteria bacterium]|nr:Uma2 family endonuclease [Acidobacteriota bacterium]
MAPRLITGERMSREEFLARWEQLPGLKNAELIEGIVYVPSPVSLHHSDYALQAHGWLWTYAQATPGCVGGANGTWMMLESAPQPDAALRILPEHGGQSGTWGKYAAGAPELALEICVTSTEVDFGPKLALYQRAGVREYITLETLLPKITWRVLRDGSYLELPRDPDGVYRSTIFPGLWLDAEAFWTQRPRLLEVLRQGLATPEHAEFAARLAAANRCPHQ